MKPWQFRQKTIGYGISRDFFLTVLTGTAALPIVEEIANPKGANGAIEGFLVPLSQSATKDDLQRPLQRGHYALSSKDRKTVLRLTVVPKEEAGFDPGPFLRSQRAKELTQEHLDRISATWSLLQLVFESHDPFVHASLSFLLKCSQRLAAMTNGIVADPISETYKLPQEVLTPTTGETDVRDVIRVWSRPKEDGLTVFTMGMRKFALPELELGAVPPTQETVSHQLLYGLCKAALSGKLYQLGGRVGSPKAAFQIAEGGFDRAMWEGIPCWELIPPTRVTTGEALAAWHSELN